METSYRIYQDLINILDYISIPIYIFLLPISLILISCQVHNIFYL